MEACPICLEVLRSPKKTQCGHRFCHACLCHLVCSTVSGVEPACPLCRAPMPGHSIGIEVLSLTFLDCMMEFVMPVCSVPTFPPSTQLTSWTEVKLGNVIVALVEEAAIVRTRADKQYMNWMFDSPVISTQVPGVGQFILPHNLANCVLSEDTRQVHTSLRETMADIVGSCGVRHIEEGSRAVVVTSDAFALVKEDTLRYALVETEGHALLSCCNE